MPSVAETTALGIFVSVYLAAIFYGLTSLQTISYFRSERARKDPVFLKVTVFALWVLDTTDSAFTALSLYRVDISNPDDIISGSVYWLLSRRLSVGMLLSSTSLSGYFNHLNILIGTDLEPEQECIGNFNSGVFLFQLNHNGADTILVSRASSPSELLHFGIMTKGLSFTLQTGLPTAATTLTPTGIEAYKV
ncbi:hypothetical protein GYMLUDRAFT_59102 [Collybiopsis luxurians FD-317 M1]|uniref:Uncharacterized protein n=1 Tax=Collybiopsis luxurians FD-317 M1 TaxID=944289 RepID=A0A0D0CXX8_9AGAR|nr:hypothetical protein GYMLUDRAFT_59102 [Collybiopsis luxurians FD-317 M1]